MGTKKSKADKHIHRLIRVQDIWKCAFSDCRFFMYSRQAEKVLLGRDTICWSCGEKFPMHEGAFRVEQPICTTCEAPEIKEFIEVSEPQDETALYLKALKNKAIAEANQR